MRDDAPSLALHGPKMTGGGRELERQYGRALKAWLDISVPGSFSSGQYLAAGAAGRGRRLAPAAVREVGQSLTAQAWKRPPRRFERRSYPSFYFSSRLEADTVDMGKKSHQKLPGSGRYLLLLIDVFSRKLFVRPLPDKRATSVAAALAKTFAGFRPPYAVPHVLETDRGKEFDNATVRRYLQKKGVRHRLARGSNKARYAERAVRSFKRVFAAYYEELQSPRRPPARLPSWELVVRRVTKNLNGHHHRTIGCAPDQMPERWQEVQRKLVVRELATSPPYPAVRRLERRGPDQDPDAAFAVGDRVLRLRDGAGNLNAAKESWRMFVKAPHRVAEVLKDKRPYLYRVEEEAGGPPHPRLFYAEELRRFGRAD